MRIPFRSQMLGGLLAFSLVFLVHGARATTVMVQVGQGGGRTFNPSTVTIQPGDTIEWDWVSGVHSVTSGPPGNPNPAFDSGPRGIPFTFSQTFATPGSYPYYCTVHGAMMSGTINVAAPTPSPTPPTIIVVVGPGGDMSFTPDPVFIQPGETVEWVWDSNFHSVTSGPPGNPDGMFDSDIQNVPYTFTFTFPTAGSFAYFCLVHEPKMVGTVVVGGSTPTPTPGPVNISGVVSQCAGATNSPLAGMTMTLTGTSSGSTTTDGAGNYSFSGLLPGGSYTVTPSKAARLPASAGINTTDVIAAQRHFLAITPLTGCRLTAGDVNASGGVNTTDVIAIQRFFIGFSTGIANVGKYGSTPASRSYSPLGGTQTSQNFDTVVFGDCAAPFANPRGGGPVPDTADDGSSALASVPKVPRQQIK